VSRAGSELLHRRAAAPPVVGNKRVCHSDVVPDPAEARELQAALGGGG
jgi:hypothetical protein